MRCRDELLQPKSTQEHPRGDSFIEDLGNDERLLKLGVVGSCSAAEPCVLCKKSWNLYGK